MEEAHKVLPLYFYDFLKINLKTKSKSLYWKIIDINVEKFLKGKPGLTYKDILQCLLKEFYKYIKHFPLKNVNKLFFIYHKTTKLKLSLLTRPCTLKIDHFYL